MIHTCPKCLEPKPATTEFFYRAKEGLCLSSCKKCRSKCASESYQRTKARKRQTKKGFYVVAMADQTKRALAPIRSMYEDVL